MKSIFLIIIVCFLSLFCASAEPVFAVSTAERRSNKAHNSTKAIENELNSQIFKKRLANSLGITLESFRESTIRLREFDVAVQIVADFPHLGAKPTNSAIDVMLEYVSSRRAGGTRQAAEEIAFGKRFIRK